MANRSLPEEARAGGDLLDEVNLQVRLGNGLAANQQSTVGAAGGASAQPATPLGYFKVRRADGTLVVVPYHNP
jgi:hypothetical protein